MSNCTPVLFKKSLIVIAIASLSACSTVPDRTGYDLGQIGDGLLKAGRSTADATGKAWQKTTYLLGFSDDDGQDSTEEQSPLALVDTTPDDATLLSRDRVITPIAIPSPALIDTKQPPQDPISTNTHDATSATLDARASQELAAADGFDDAGSVQDLIHSVAPQETLWDIAKLTTGDSNNWHVLAEVNNLGPNASVFPGQQLIIPADMITGDDEQTPVDSLDSLAANSYINTQDLTRIDNTQTSQPVNAPQSELAAPELPESPLEGATTGQGLANAAFELQPGETLWDFAKRTTGDATQWQAIADANNFSLEQASVVRTGQTILVPKDLLKPEGSIDVPQQPAVNAAGASAEALENSATERSHVLATPSVIPADTPTANADSGTAQSAPSATEQQPLASNSLAGEGEEQQPIKIVEAAFKADDPSEAPLESDELGATAAAPTDTADGAPTEIMVSGTYYPKAIYNEANFSSSLLMRVSPGTTLQVSKTLGNWFQVKTDKGFGYVHQRDIK